VTLLAGHRLGPYEVLGALGAGGMGEVYRARDTRLGRDVALKVLPVDVARDPDRRRRFEREARAVAALNHPGVLAIYDVGEADGIDFIVTELLEGETLRARLGRGPVSCERVAEWGASVADALAVAHAGGIVHRDLKPENLFLTRDGRLKVLDFGLAKDLTVTGSEDATLSTPTSAGIVLGTVGYLSPEQARGERVDYRSDLFSLGCVLYEALAGRRPFGGKTAQDHIAAVLRDEPPDAASIRGDAPPGLTRVVQRCLAKEREERFQSASDLAFALRSAAPTSAANIASPPSGPRARGRGVTLALGLGLVGLAAGYWLRPSSEAPEPVVLALTSGTSREASPVISPDGKFVAYFASEGGRTDVWVQFVGGGPAVNLTAGRGLVIQSQATIGGLEISPDGSSIAVRAGPPEQPGPQRGIWLIPAPLGGPPRKLMDRAGGLRWSADGSRIAYMRADPASGDAILVARSDGAEERVLVPATQGLHLHEPAWSHDGAWIYFNRGAMGNNDAPTGIWRVPSGGGPAEPVVETQGVARDPLPTPDGRALIYAGDQSGGALNLWWRPLRGGRERRLTRGAGDYLEPRVSRDGQRLVCEARTSVGSLRVLGIREPSAGLGHTLTGAGVQDASPSTARNGRIAFSSARNGTQDIWTSDADGTNARPLTSDPESDSLPAISPDGSRVAFVSDRGGRRGLWLVSAEGGPPRSLAPVAVVDRPSWSPDGRRLVYSAEGPDAQRGLWVVSADGGAPAAVPGIRGRAPAWSPSADLIAYFTSAPSAGLLVRFTTSRGESLPDHPDLSTNSVDSLAFSWNGRWLATGVSPGAADTEIVVVDLESGGKRSVVRLPPFTGIRGVGWSPDDERLVYGLVQYESRILLFDGLGRY
jgi:serine/threonine protein kinase/Tol biopolymer transport system component